MAQNSQRLKWSAEEVDNKLKDIMQACFKNCLETAKEYVPAAEGEYPSLVVSTNGLKGPMRLRQLLTYIGGG
jgi:glutamate dehydrogenase (NADP+)